ncbi:hypothetical protein [Anaerobutyricum hallii]|uniref:hypothetical protein n=1 Tax=Anaerobutyricum hallii TaxID=39488 RepID=UPI003521998F
MGENAQKIGKKLEKLGVELFEMFNWNKKMGDKEIKCSRATHKNAEGKKKQTHGIDLYMEYEDPYIGGIQGVFIECKNRKWDGITKNAIQTWVNEEINLIDCARNNSELQEFYGEGADRNCALLLINCNDGRFDKNKFDEYLSQIKVKNKRTPYKIFIAGNHMINRWDAVGRMIREDYYSGLNVLYPSINYSKPLVVNHWSINQLFSKYIFCEYKQEVKMGVNGGTYIQKILVVFFFDVINAESFKYMWSMCRAFQYEIQYDEFDICFWAEKKEESDYIKENFISILASGEGKDSIEKEVLEKIKIKVLLNRKLNVVDN